MTIQTVYPVFESGQVLTEEALNTIIAYLEPQDRLSRSRLSGIGILCGLQPVTGQGATQVTVTKGVAVTSEGYLIARPDTVYSRARPYVAPVPAADRATADEIARARYPFLFDGQVQRSAFELFEPAVVVPVTEVQPVPLDAAFLADKVLMLFLEERRDALRNCDVNDCSDKGSSLQLTLRPLLIARADADRIIAEEAALVPGVAVDRANHPRLGLRRMAVARLMPLGTGALTWPALYRRQLAIGLDALLQAADALPAAQGAHAAVLAPGFPAGGPPPQVLMPVAGHFALMPLLAQTVYHAGQDLSLALDEALAAGAVLDTECHPDPRRFPRHVLAGQVGPADLPTTRFPRDLAEVQALDAAAMRQGPKGGMPPAPRRHHFIPAPVADQAAAEAFRSLWHRLLLMPLSHTTADLVGGPVRLSPSRAGAAALGDRAIPAHYDVDGASALTACWNPAARRRPPASPPTGWRLLPADPGAHPLRQADDAVDFIRIEGVAGLPLGRAWSEILRQKRALGLSFAIAPVLAPTGDPEIDKREEEIARQAMSPYLACQMQDLTSNLRTMVQGFMPFLAWLARTVASIDAGRSVRPPEVVRPETIPGGDGIFVPGREFGIGIGIEFATAAVSPIERSRSALLADAAFVAVRGDRAEVGPATTISRSLLAAETGVAPGVVELAKGSVLSFLEEAKLQGEEAELSDRLRRVVTGQGLGRPQAEGLLLAVLPVVSLLNRTEAAMKVIGAIDVATYDAARVSDVLSALLMSFDAYAEKADTDPRTAGEANARANSAILGSRGTLTAGLAQFGSGALGAEIARRTAAAFAATVLPAYARAHPGLDHKGGTPAVGTFVLLYCRREVLPKMLDLALQGTAEDFAAAWAKLFGGAAPVPDANAVLRAVEAASRQGGREALDDYVVLGDLCLPTQCCDATCAEDVVADRFPNRIIRFTRPGIDDLVDPLDPFGVGRPQPSPQPDVIIDRGPVPLPTDPLVTPEPRGGGIALPVDDVIRNPVRDPVFDPVPNPREAPTGLVTGTVVLQRERGEATPARSATVVFTPGGGGAPQTAEAAADGSFRLALPEGRYEVVATFRQRTSDPVRVAVKEGQTASLALTIKV